LREGCVFPRAHQLNAYIATPTRIRATPMSKFTSRKVNTPRIIMRIVAVDPSRLVLTLACPMPSFDS
jgi:hypothetical protein